MEEEQLTERLSVRVSESYASAIKSFMRDEGIGKEGVVIRMALKRFLEARGYLSSSGLAVNTRKNKDNLASAYEKADDKGNALKNSARRKIADYSEKKK